jgi:hypothetical protein
MAARKTFLLHIGEVEVILLNYLYFYSLQSSCSSIVGWDTVLQVGRSQFESRCH